MITRRRVLGASLAGAAAALWSQRARAIGPGSKFRIGQLALGAPPPRPGGLSDLLWELDKRTSIEVEREAPLVTPTAPTLHETPFLYLAGDRDFAVPSPAGVEALRRFLTFGGFLLIDSAEGTTDGAFDKSVRALCAALYPAPATNLEIVPSDHVVYKSFYLLERPLGRLAISPVMEGITRSGRLTVAYVQNDLGGAWTKDNFGNFDFPCEPGGDRQRELAYRMGINLAMYALCLDYKTDQVHVPFIMRRRRWRPDDGAQTPPATTPPAPPASTPPRP